MRWYCLHWLELVVIALDKLCEYVLSSFVNGRRWWFSLDVLEDRWDRSVTLRFAWSCVLHHSDCVAV